MEQFPTWISRPLKAQGRKRPAFASPQNPVLNDLSVAQVVESKRRMDSDKRGAVDRHSGAVETASSSGLVRAHEEQAVVVDNGDAKAVKPTGAAKEVPVECGVLGKEDDR
jgi:hypothetical protein